MAHTTTSADRERLWTGLLVTAVALLAVLVAGLGAGSLLLLHEYRELRKQLVPSGPLRTAEELTKRQQETSARIATIAHRTAKKFDVIEARLDRLSQEKLGPVDRALQMMQGMSDEMRLLTLNFVDLQVVAADALKPLPQQQEALDAGGAAGSEGGEGKKGSR